MAREGYATADAKHGSTLVPPPEGTMFGSIKTYASRLMRGLQPQGPVLLVDDEEAVLRFVDRVLRDAGYKTATASNGPQALEIARKIGPLGALVTDVMMPGMTGDELARLLRQTEPGLKVLYLTGYSDRLFKEKTMLWADEAFLDKPCSVKGLREAVSLLLFGRVGAITEAKT
jgi:two-component system, cell cycle sensor histidine kinase and response regulator CckA